MRKRDQGPTVTVHAIAGTYVVLLGLDIAEENTAGLLGFTITRETAGKGEKKVLRGGRRFAGVDAEDKQPGSDKAPIQAFLWGDYEAEPGQTYTYRVVPQYGKPGAMKPGPEASVTVSTEKREDGTHSIYFNRGVAGSQAYGRRFGDHRRFYLVDQHGEVVPKELIKPEAVPDREALRWLSRGLEEAMLDFIAQAKGPGYSIRAAVYEFTHEPAIQAFVDALERGVDVKIVHHAKRKNVLVVTTEQDQAEGAKTWKVNATVTSESGEPLPKQLANKLLALQEAKDEICQAADAALGRIGLRDAKHFKAFGEMVIERKITQISHNKFIVLLKDGKPLQVWTGSTNFTAGGIFGQSNVGHVVRDETIAAKYLAYWKKLSEDPKKAEMTAWTAKQTPDLTKMPPKDSITPIFSPRPKRAMLDWYAKRIGDATQSVFFTAAFSVDDSMMEEFLKVKEVDDGAAYLRYIILETKGGLMRDKYKALTPVKQNRVVYGDVLKTRPGGAEDIHIEALTGLNVNVQYIHTKYLLIDPLSDDPLVMTGSANFSKASTTDNDENLLVIRGDTRVADIFIGEFMRLFNHFAIRNKLNSLSDEKFAESQNLAADDSWLKNYFKEGTPEQQERLLFR